jgi:hypothetical protein
MIHCQTTKLEDHPVSDVRDCLCNISALTFHMWRGSLCQQSEKEPCCDVKGLIKYGNINFYTIGQSFSMFWY